MTMPHMKSPKTWLIASAGILVAGAAVWGLSGRPEVRSEIDMPKGLSAEEIKQQAVTDPGRLRETVREAARNENLTDAQRRQLAGNMREAWRSGMNERVTEYVNAPDDEKDAVLDKHLDEMQARWKEWEKRREEEDKKGEESGREDFRRLFGERSQQDRKADSESRNPDEMARGMAYFNALRSRAAERGIPMPRGPRGGAPGGRGPGGGPGGRSPGGGRRP